MCSQRVFVERAVESYCTPPTLITIVPGRCIVFFLQIQLSLICNCMLFVMTILMEDLLLIHGTSICLLSLSPFSDTLTPSSIQFFLENLASLFGCRLPTSPPPQ